MEVMLFKATSAAQTDSVRDKDAKTGSSFLNMMANYLIPQGSGQFNGNLRQWKWSMPRNLLFPLYRPEKKSIEYQEIAHIQQTVI